MGFDYVDYEEYYEKSELEELREEYLKKAKELFNKDLKDKIAEIAQKQIELENERNRQFQKEYELKQKEYDLTNREKGLENKKNQIVLDWMKEYGLDLKPGQVVYYLKSEYKHGVCKICRNEGKIYKNIDGEKYEKDCPICKGYSNYFGSYEYRVEKSKISDMIFKFYYNTSKNDLYLEGEYSGIYLAAREGQKKRKDIYITLEEAQKACDELNKKEQERIKQ